jgi:acyl carrier protein
MEETIIEIMKDVLDEQDINIDSTQDSLENWNSLRHLNLVSELEDEFDVEFEPEEIAEMKSVKAILELINTKKSED